MMTKTSDILNYMMLSLSERLFVPFLLFGIRTFFFIFILLLILYD